MIKHKLYKQGDNDAPEYIKDRNAQIVLNLCKRCGKYEDQLKEPCMTFLEKEY